MLGAASAMAADIHVSVAGSDSTGTGSASAPFLTIQAGVNAATNGDNVVLADGIYSGPGNIAINMSGKDIVVRSASDNPSNCIVECGGAVVGFQFLAGETPFSGLRGITVRNARAAGTFSASMGAAVRMENSSPTMTKCNFEGNLAIGDNAGFLAAGNGYGGAISGFNCNSTFVDCNFTNNVALGGNGFTAFDTGYGAGGAFYGLFANVRFTRCKFIGNTAGGGGYGSGTAESFGGAIMSDTGSVLLENCYFASNSANQGGGTYVLFGLAEANNCAFASNKALSGRGGGVMFSGSFFDFTNCSAGGNSATLGGGAVYAADFSFGTFDNSVVWTNSADVGSAGVEIDSGSSCDFAYMILQASGGSASWSVANGFDNGNNLDVDPLFQSNPSISGAGNMRLKAGSPAIDSGNNALLSPVYATDLDGQTRIVKGTIDRGAYEAVIDPIAMTQALKASVQALVGPGGLTQLQANALKASLDVAIAQMQTGRKGLAIVSLQVFQATVIVYDVLNLLTPSQASALINSANAIITVLRA